MGRVDLTAGSVSKGIVLFALPLLGTSIIQQLYSTVDLLFVGNMLCALATFLSNALAAVIAAVLLARFLGRSERRAGGLDREFVRFVLAFGLPIAAQTLAIVLSNVVVHRQIDFLGVEAVAAFVIYLKVELPIYFPILAIGQAALPPFARVR